MNDYGVLQLDTMKIFKIIDPTLKKKYSFCHCKTWLETLPLNSKLGKIEAEWVYFDRFLVVAHHLGVVLYDLDNPNDCKGVIVLELGAEYWDKFCTKEHETICLKMSFSSDGSWIFV